MRKRYIVLLAGLSFLMSCHSPRYVYSPSPPNNPYFTQKGESKLTAYYSSGNANNGKNDGYDLQGAYAITDHWALTAGYFHRRERDVFPLADFNFFDSSIVDYKRKLVDFGGGYFVPLNKIRTISVNMLAGMALGKFSSTDWGVDKQGMVYNRFHNSNILKWYLQPSLNILPGKYFRAGFIFKFSFVHYDDITTSYSDEEIDYFDLNRISNKTLYYFEPTFNMQLGIPGIDWMKVDAGFTFSSDPIRSETRIDGRNFNASIGFTFDFSKLKK